MKFYKAILHTGNKTKEDILRQAKREKWIGELSDKDIEDIITYNNYLDGCEVIVIESLDKEEYYLATWDSKIEKKIKEAIYILEQDQYFGTYINKRDKFNRDWAAGEYEPGGMISFSQEEIEIMEVIKSDGAAEEGS